jgi:subtilisin family serine protease
MTRSVSGRVGSLTALVGGILATLSGCDRPADPLAPPGSRAARAGAGASPHPFYYYQGEPVYLDADPTRIVVATHGAPADAARQVLATLGITATPSPLPQAADHWLLTLPGGTDRAVAEQARARLRSDGRFAFVSEAFKAPAWNDADVILVDRLVVRFKDGVSPAQVDSINAALGTRVIRPPRPDSGYKDYLLAYPERADADPLEVAAILDRHPLVAWADPDKVSDRRRAGAPSDPFYSSQYYLQSGIFANNVPVDINVLPAWGLTMGSGAVTVAIIDDGVDSWHPEWNGRFYEGFDAMYRQALPGEWAGAPYGDDSHGTAVAGIIAAAHDGVGTAGIAPYVRISAARIFRGGTTASDADIANAITWASQRSDVMNNSWGGGSPSNAITSAINTAATQGRGGKGSVIVFSAGNTSNRSAGIIGAPTYPATLSSVISVGAINSYGALTNYTPEGSRIDLVAPSSHLAGSMCYPGDLVTTERSGTPGCNNGPGGTSNYTSTFGGTSAAAPQVSGVAALLLSRDQSLTGAQVKSRLLQAAVPWGSATQVGHGKLDAYHTLVP